MLHQSLKLTASTMMIAIVGAVSACLPDTIERPATEPAMSLLAVRQPGLFVRTMPARPAAKMPVAAIESVAAMRD